MGSGSLHSPSPSARVLSYKYSRLCARVLPLMSPVPPLCSLLCPRQVMTPNGMALVQAAVATGAALKNGDTSGEAIQAIFPRSKYGSDPWTKIVYLP